MERFEVTVGQSGTGRHIVAVTGELDMAVADGLWERIEPLLTPGGVVVLDGTEMSFLDSTGLRVLLQAGRHAEEQGAAFRLVVPQEAVRRVLELTGTADRLDTRADVYSALGD